MHLAFKAWINVRKDAPHIGAHVSASLKPVAVDAAAPHLCEVIVDETEVSHSKRALEKVKAGGVVTDVNTIVRPVDMIVGEVQVGRCKPADVVVSVVEIASSHHGTLAGRAGGECSLRRSTSDLEWTRATSTGLLQIWSG